MVLGSMPVGRPYPVVVTVAGLVWLPNEDFEKSDCKLFNYFLPFYHLISAFLNFPFSLFHRNTDILIKRDCRLLKNSYRYKIHVEYLLSRYLKTVCCHDICVECLLARYIMRVCCLDACWMFVGKIHDEFVCKIHVKVCCQDTCAL